MADDDDIVDEEAEDEEGASGGGLKKLVLFVVLPLLIIVGGAAGAYFAGLLDPVVTMITGVDPAAEEAADDSAMPATAVFYELPEMLVNLNTGGRKTSYLKLKLSLEIEKADDMPLVESAVPRVSNDFQVFLRELRVDDLQGSAGIYRVQEELLARVNKAVSPVQVKNVLINEMLVQ